MPNVVCDGVSIHYEARGQGSPVLLLAGLAGVGTSWGPQIDLFAEHHQVIIPDHRGTGASDHAARAMTIPQHARDMARVMEAVECGPVHVVGSSTGGAISQLLAIHHRYLLRSATIISSIARADAYYRRQFAMRRRMLTDSGLRAWTEANALLLFDPRFQREHPERVEAWVNAASTGTFNPEVGFARIDMIVGHDAFDDLPSITTPTLVLVGAHDFCAPPHFSAELAARIPGAELVIVDGGHFVFLEKPELLHDTVEAFIAGMNNRAIGRHHEDRPEGCASDSRAVRHPADRQVLQPRGRFPRKVMTAMGTKPQIRLALPFGSFRLLSRLGRTPGRCQTNVINA